MSVAASAKAKLVGANGVLAALLPGVIVGYSMPAKNIPRELVYAGSVTGPVELKAMAGGGRVKRSEDLTLLLHIRVCKPGETAETVEARAVEIGDVIATYIAGNTTLAGVADLKLARVTAVELDAPWTDDDGAGSTLTLAVGLMSYLT